LLFHYLNKTSVIERFSITGSGVMPISPLRGAKFQIRPHILKAH